MINLGLELEAVLSTRISHLVTAICKNEAVIHTVECFPAKMALLWRQDEEMRIWSILPPDWKR
jgi:hypothetical protein